MISLIHVLLFTSEPIVILCFLLQKLRCFLEGGPHKPVTLTLTGMCIGVPPVREGQHFITSVRTKDTKNLSISNRSNQQWNLKPIIDGEQWSGPVSFIVEPLQTKQYELTYYPLTMTQEGKKHQVGSKAFHLQILVEIFVGSSIVYQLKFKLLEKQATSVQCIL